MAGAFFLLADFFGKTGFPIATSDICRYNKNGNELAT